MSRMEKKILTRYLILVVVLIVCAGAAWLISEQPGRPQGDAVLAWSEEDGWKEWKRRMTDEVYHTTGNDEREVQNFGE